MGIDKNVAEGYAEMFESVLKPTDMLSVAFERNGCVYAWLIPVKNFRAFQNLQSPIQDESMIALGGKLNNILIRDKYTIDFKGNGGVKKLDVFVFSSETEDKQLLHQVSTEFRAKEKLLNRDSIPGTNKNK